MTNKEAAEVLRHHLRGLLLARARGDSKPTARYTLNHALMRAILILEKEESREQL